MNLVSIVNFEQFLLLVLVILQETLNSQMPAVISKNPPWLGDRVYQTKRFHPVRQQGEFVGATQLRPEQTDLLYSNAREIILSGRI